MLRKRAFDEVAQAIAGQIGRFPEDLEFVREELKKNAAEAALSDVPIDIDKQLKSASEEYYFDLSSDLLGAGPFLAK